MPRIGDGYHTVSGGLAEIFTNYRSGNIAVNYSWITRQWENGVRDVVARNGISDFEWKGTIEELTRFPVLNGRDGPFYLIRENQNA